MVSDRDYKHDQVCSCTVSQVITEKLSELTELQMAQAKL